ncbi:16S rRNA (guanine(527)-N(7))-methyltransferase RsmG [Pseudooceanicola sp. MF1-13]|uniref:16S rRNA (guanine(527)-N(7))-methyltransferase RsmG n=1 Tax=Pseudooceanicola sp. MF1-13 TaxID=3379095 RepID=UPI00389220E1
MNVSRETKERLKTYEALLKKWNPKINLVAKSTIDDAWTRHIEDSIQVFNLGEVAEGLWLDMGSGGGFPGLVCAIMAHDTKPDLMFQLVDSDQRKCAFLRNTAREVGVQVKVMASRLDDLNPAAATIISARALAPLGALLNLAEKHRTPDTVMLFQKGRSWKDEVEEARKEWRFQHEVIPSKTDPEAVILKIKEVEHV